MEIFNTSSLYTAMALRKYLSAINVSYTVRENVFGASVFYTDDADAETLKHVCLAFSSALVYASKYPQTT